jgi:hypothetical protein
MRMVKAIVVAVALLGMGVASAQEIVEVERRERSTAGIILRDALGGALVGSAVSGGIILYEMGIEDNDDYNWERTLAWGALIGLGAGLVWGVVDVASAPAYAATTPLARAPVRDGNSITLDTRRRDESHRTMMPLLATRF